MGPLIWAAVAFAEPVALRVPVDGPVTTAVGTRSASVGIGFEGFALAADVGWDGRTGGASIGTRRILADAGAWRWEVGGAVGLVALPLARTVGLGLTPFASAGVVGGRGALVATVAIPAVGAPTGLRLPLSVELAGGPRIGPVWVTPRIAGGPVWTPGLDVALSGEVGIAVTVGRERSAVSRQPSEGPAGSRPL